MYADALRYFIYYVNKSQVSFLSALELSNASVISSVGTKNMQRMQEKSFGFLSIPQDIHTYMTFIKSN